MPHTRRPVGSGTFYPALPGRLRSDVRTYMRRAGTPRRAHAALAPHAAYNYCGVTAGALFASVVVPATCIIVSPNHRGRGTSPEGGSLLLTRQYRTPLGDLPVDLELAEALINRAAPLLADDQTAHAGEHGIEVLLPFLQMRRPDVAVVPIVLSWSDWERTRQLARVIADTVGEREDVLLLVSTDMNHYEPAGITEQKDTLALERILRLDGEGLLDVTRRKRISMCGRIPAACGCEYARRRGARDAEVVAYSHSGLVTRDEDQVVGYAAVLLGPE